MKKPAYFFALLMLLTFIFSYSAQAQDRKGWSPQAKGAVIGGLGGAAAGAFINKRNRAVGGLIGGVVGGGAGYAIGKHRDNKNKERARIAEANRVAAYRAEQAQRERAALARQAAVGRPQSAVAANSLAPAAALAPMHTAPAAASGAYLPNTIANPAANPYAASEYRRKSW